MTQTATDVRDYARTKSTDPDRERLRTIQQMLVNIAGEAVIDQRRRDLGDVEFRDHHAFETPYLHTDLCVVGKGLTFSSSTGRAHPAILHQVYSSAPPDCTLIDLERMIAQGKNMVHHQKSVANWYVVTIVYRGHVYLVALVEFVNLH